MKDTKKTVDITFIPDQSWKIMTRDSVACNHCEYTSIDEDNMQLHVAKAHGITQQCFLCLVGLENWEDLIEHMRKRHFPSDTKLYTCAECGATRTIFEIFIVHLKKHFQRPQRKYKSSPRMHYANPSSHGTSYSSSMKNFLGINPDDGLQVVSPSNVQPKAQTASEKEPAQSHRVTYFVLPNGEVKECTDISLKCQYCHHIGQSPEALDDHVRRHFDVREHVCEECHKAFVSKGELERHTRCKHPDAESPMYECQNCFYFSRRRDSLAKHIIEKHSEVKNVGSKSKSKPKSSGKVKRITSDCPSTQNQQETRYCGDLLNVPQISTVPDKFSVLRSLLVSEIW